MNISSKVAKIMDLLMEVSKIRNSAVTLLKLTRCSSTLASDKDNHKDHQTD